MKFLVLAAGEGKRLQPYTKNKPKCMLEFNGKTLIKHQIDRCGDAFSKIIVVKGYKEEMINYRGVKYYVNKDYVHTNMVESLMIACEEFDDDIIVSYGDIYFNADILDEIIKYKGDFVATVDTNWQKYWKMRYGLVNYDTESLVLSPKGLITEIGAPSPPINKMDARYVGLLKFSKKGLQLIEEIYNSSNKWKTAYMTDLLQEIISKGYPVHALKIKNGWLEFDEKKDYEKGKEWLENKLLKKLNVYVN